MEFRTNRILAIATTTLMTISLIACGQNYDFGVPSKSEGNTALVTYNSKVDVVFIVDDSESMKVPQDSLKAAIPGMVAKLAASGLDLRIGVISTSMGGSGYSGGKLLGNPKILGIADSVALSNRLILGTDGRDREAGIESLFTMLENEGGSFLRDEAMLAIIEITNEDDSSGLGTVDEYIAALDNIKKPWANGKRSWFFNVIGVLTQNTSCQTNPGSHYIEKAENLIDLASKTGGQIESVCSMDLTNAVSNIKARIVDILREFKLSKVPNVSTIVVKLNGVVVPRSKVNGWDYIPANNSVRFYGTYQPQPYANVQIDYAPDGAN